jgi:hypothetical protein
VTSESSGVGQQRGEPLDPPVDRDVIDLDPAFGEQLLDVSVGQAIAQVPAHRHHDHLGREPEAGEGGRASGPDTRPRCMLHRSSLPELAIRQRNRASGDMTDVRVGNQHRLHRGYRVVSCAPLMGERDLYRTCPERDAAARTEQRWQPPTVV